MPGLYCSPQNIFLLLWFPFSSCFLSSISSPIFSSLPPLSSCTGSFQKMLRLHWCWQSCIFPGVLGFIVFSHLSSHQCCNVMCYNTNKHWWYFGGMWHRGPECGAQAPPHVVCTAWQCAPRWCPFLCQSVIQALSAQGSLFLIPFFFLCPIKPYLGWDLLGIQFVNCLLSRMMT